MRQKQLEELSISLENQIWIDGLGIEWINLVLHSFQEEGFNVKLFVSRANLPTITSKNSFPKNVKVFRELDDISHKYFNFPESLIKQFEVLETLIEDIIKRAKNIFDNSNRVLITGDHGLTRYQFNKQVIPLPKGAEIPHKWGRTAFIKKLTPDIIDPEKPWVKEDNQIYLLRHGRFEGSRGAPNEVHGGASPEEVLIPVMLIQKKTTRDGIIFKVLTEKIQLDIAGKGFLYIKIDPDLDGVKVRFPSGKEIAGERIKVGKYAFQVQGIDSGRYELILKTGEKFIGKFIIEIVSAGLKEEDLGI